MTLTALPINASSGSPAYTALQTRQALSSLIYNGTARELGGQSGFLLGKVPTMTATSSTWTITPFAVVVDAAFTTTQGPYFVSNDANSTGSVTAANATNPRYDIVYVQVNDTDIDGSGLRSVTVSYLAGTAAASPVPPATPARSFLLCAILVPQSGGGSPSVTANQQYSAAAGGILPVLGATQRDAFIVNPVEGMYVDDATLNGLCRYSGSAWISITTDTGWVSASMGNSWVNFGAPYTSMQYRLKNGAVYLEGTIKSGTSSTTIFTLPAGMRPLNSLQLTCPSVSGTAQIIVSSAGAVSVNLYTTGGANGGVSFCHSFVAEQ